MTTPHHFWDLFEKTAREVLDQRHCRQNEIDAIAALTKKSKKFAIYPCNRYSRKIISHIEKKYPDNLQKLVGVFDKSDNFNFRNDVPLFNLREIDTVDFDTLIVATSKFPEDLLPDIRQAGVAPEKVVVTSYFRDQLSNFNTDELIAKIKAVTDLLVDKQSRITYLLTWTSLLLLDKDILSVYHQPVDMEYQPSGTFTYQGMTLKHLYNFAIQASLYLEIYRMEHVSPAPNDIIFDIGAYRGDTVAFFRKYLQESGHIYAFEPDDINFSALEDNITSNHLDNVTPVKKALIDQEKQCTLIATPKSSSFLYIINDALTTDSVTEISATTVDQFMTHNNIPRLDFIKSDIEGCELAMLKGGAKSIQRHTPKMALAIYHSIADLLEVPLYVNKLNPDYKLYLRHWNFEGSPWEIQLYATP